METIIDGRRYIFFKVKYNHFRDVSNSDDHKVLDCEDIRECECVLALPESYSSDGEETQLILACHGAGGVVREEDQKIGGLAHINKCIDAGYAALDVCGSEPFGTTMGCPEHIFALYKAYRYAIRHYNLSERVLLSGASMGGHVVMNFANTFPGISIAVGMFFPRLNMDGVTVDGHYCLGSWDKTTHSENKPSIHDLIIDIYRFPSDEWCEENTLGFNPYRTRSFINSEGKRVIIPPCPIKIWQGKNDSVVDPVINKEYVNAVRRSGSYIELHMIDGIGHKLTDVMKEEQLMWFNRFI